jgi:ParB family transcriptional regulator, chromosome partitioning protein
MNKTDTTRRALGKGLSSLLPTRPTAQPAMPPAPTAPPQPVRSETPAKLAIDAIEPNPLQPRRVFEDARLAELSQSILANGIIQPLVVRKVGERYQLVAGERRWRASKLAGLKEVPVVVQEISDEHLLEVTLIENIQREDLNPIETAVAFERLGRELGLNAEEVGKRTGKDRSTVLNFQRLLQLPQQIQQMVSDRLLTGGHARCLLSLPTPELQLEVAAKAIEQSWSVRQTERTTQRMIEGAQPKHVAEVEVDPNVKAALRELERALGTKVRIVEKSKQRGKIEIDYYSQEDLDRIYSLIVQES